MVACPCEASLTLAPAAPVGALTLPEAPALLAAVAAGLIACALPLLPLLPLLAMLLAFCPGLLMLALLLCVAEALVAAADGGREPLAAGSLD